MDGAGRAMSAGLPTSLLSQFKAVIGDDAVVTDPVRLQPRLTEWRGLFSGQAAAMLMPARTDEAAAVMKLCYKHGIGMVPQGGNTSLVGGSIPHSDERRPEVILATDRLNRIRNLDADNFTITAEAGCVLADLQTAAAGAQRLFPLSLGAEGSCRIGGNVSTNAGGINVLRYGNTRSLVLGLEVVLPDGRVFDGLRALRKDNTGYDLKQLFIGAEGTLGLVTAVCCRLFPQPGSRATAMVGVTGPQAAIELLSAARASLGDGLEAFELINRQALELVVQHIPGSRDPLDTPQPCYVLLEAAVPGDDAVEQLERFLSASLQSGQVLDGVLAQNQALAQLLWHMRHSISEAQKHAGAGIKHDVSVPVSQVGHFIEQASAAARRLVADAPIVAFGHLGDGNIHFNVNQPAGMETDAFLALWQPVSRAVHDVAVGLGGSFSAEHGVGALKRDDLARYRGGTELELMRSIKAVIDPRGLMNPGKLF